MDVSVFGAEHIYQTPTSIPIYGGSTPHDPEVIQVYRAWNFKST